MMSLRERIESSPERMKNFQRERLELEITELICDLMAQEGVSRSELAKRLGKSRPYITKLLQNGNNMTLNTISDIFFALGRSLRMLDRPLSIESPRLVVMDLASQRPSSAESGNFRFEFPSQRQGKVQSPPRQPRKSETMPITYSFARETDKIQPTPHEHRNRKNG